MRHDRLQSSRASAGLYENDGLVFGYLRSHPDEFRAVGKLFHIHEYGLGISVILQVFQKFHLRKSGLIAHADEFGEAYAFR